MTHRIYYTEPYCRTFSASVTRAFEHEGRPAITLDRTAFYPTSGGQPFDTGRIETAHVTDTLDVDDAVVHILSAPIAEGAMVAGEIDWPRRFDHMQQHTGQHLLSAAFDRLFDNRTMSFHMGSESSSIDLAHEAAAADVERAVDEANQVIWEDRPVSIRFVAPGEAEKLALRKEPTRGGTLRLIDIDGFDLSACGGTHVSRTGAVGIVGVLGTERFRGGTRVTFVCGGRASRALRGYREAVAGSIRALSVLPAELPGAIERVLAEEKELRKSVKRLQEALATHEGARLRAAAPTSGDVRVVVEVLEEWDAAGLKAIAAAVTAGGKACAVLLSSASIVVARSADVRVDANVVLRQLTERFGGRGGGRPELAQGGGLSGSPREIAAAARAFLESQL